MIDTGLYYEMVSFVSRLALCCKDCNFRGGRCATCPSSTASVLMRRIEPVKMAESPLQAKSAAVTARKQLIVAKVAKSDGQPCFAEDIKIPGCSSAVRSIALAELVRDGILIRSNEAHKLHSYSLAKGTI